MRNYEIDTSHDLADLLEDAAKRLRMLPSVRFSDAQGRVADDRLSDRRGRRNYREAIRQDGLALVAEELRESSRLDAEARLGSLTVGEIRQIAPSLGVRIPSKGTKSEYIQMLLTQVFDAPAGQELIRTFHKRSGGSSDAK